MGEMSKQNLVIDAWMREAYEALNLVEDIESRVKNNKIRPPEQHHNWTRDATRSKLSEVGVTIDRLESLLHNPPSKPLLTNEDVEYRWKVLRDVQMRTRALALCLYALPDSKRSGNLLASDNKEKSASINDCQQGDIEHSFSKNDTEALQPLISDDVAECRLQVKESSTFSCRSLIHRILWIFCLILGSAVILLVLVVICAVI